MAVLAGIFDAFVNPWLLAGLALLSAPIIIHLLNKRQYTVVEWAAMDFLLQADSRNRRRLRFEDLILLLLRMALLALFVFAVARPIVRGLGGAREDERIVILDDSFSMESSDGTGTAFSTAKANAVTQVEEAVGRSIPVSVWSGTRPELGSIDLKMPAPGESLASLGGSVAPLGSSESSVSAPQGAAEEASRLLGAIRARETTDLPLRLSTLLSRLGDQLEAKKAPETRSITLVSDFRAADWIEEGATVLRSDIASALAELKSRGALDNLRWRFIDAGQPGRENTAVTGVRLSTEHPLAKVPVRILVEVRNFGAEDRKHVTGEVEVGALDPAALDSPRSSAGTRLALQTLHRIPLPAIEIIPAGKSATAEVEFTFEKSGKYPITARIESDRLARDDGSFAVAHVRDGLRALVVDGDPGPTRFSGESGFLLSAVAPRGAVPSGILPRRFRGEGEITAKDVRDQDVVLILNRPGLAPAEKAVLEDFVRQGGGIAFFLGNRVKPDSYAGLSIFPAVLKAVKEAPPRFRKHLRIGDNPHAAFDVFRGVEGSSLEQVGFDRCFALEPAPGATVAARFDDSEGTAAIIDSPSGKGRAAVFNMTADRDWNDWPTDPSYPIVLQEWIRYLAPKRARAAVITAGDVLSWEPAAGLTYSVSTPGGAVAKPDAAVKTDSVPEQDSAKPAGGTSLPAGMLAFSATYLAGFYAVIPSARQQASEVSPDALEPRLFACRRDARESDLEPAGEARLRAALAPAGVDFVMGRDASAGVFEKAEEGETWRWLALTTGIFLLVELLVAWWFGRR